MNVTVPWRFVTLAILAHATLIQETARAEESVKLVVAVSRPLLKFATRSRQTVLTRILEESELRTPGGKRIQIEPITMTSDEMIKEVLNGSLKAHILIPSSHVYLDLADREWSLRTGKPLTAEQAVFMYQPYVLAVRRQMAEAMGWPAQDIGWADVINVARAGWKSIGHPEWGSLKLIIANPDFSDAGLHAVMSVALSTVGRPEELTSEALGGSALATNFKALDNTVVWYPSTIDDFLRNEALDVPPRCHMAFLPEHLMLTLNDRHARRNAPPGWVAIYPTKGTFVDSITAAVIQREWVTQEQREAASVALKLLKTPEAQKRLMAMGYRPALPDLTLSAPLAEAMGIDPTRPRQAIELPPVEVVLDCLSLWEKEWKSRNAEVENRVPVTATALTAPTSLPTTSHLTPIVQCVRLAKPSIITIRSSKTKKIKGTGVIVDARGYALTNAHVVGKDNTVEVSFIGSADRVLVGEVMRKDVNQDLAVIRIHPPGKYPVARFAERNDVDVGETVVAIGNPLGYQGSVTVGIISGLNRQLDIPSVGVIDNLIQTDASINPGNSGGPLLDANGELIGIVMAIRSDAENIAFAIPADRLRAYVKQHLPE
jgi:hypothetical protein